ncbi:MAG TPA: hypothetical protein VNV65_12435 [Candidatus Solibacter sp.]|nr:hypothetical protein [Candidatus Solibacter sp.]
MPPETPGGSTAPSGAEPQPLPVPPADEAASTAPPPLQPGRGAPLVPGPPNSVSPPINAGRVNAVFGIGGLLGILVLIVIVVVVGLLLISALSSR